MALQFVLYFLNSEYMQLMLSMYKSCQDQTVDGIHHLCEFTRKMEPVQNRNVGQASRIACVILLWHVFTTYSERYFGFQVSSSIPASIEHSLERIVRVGT